MNWENSPLQALVGKTVIALERADHGICFVTADERLYYYFAADCCSESWLFRIRNVRAVIGTVLGIVDVSTDDVDINDGLCRQEYDQAYGIGVKTERGVCEIVYRNSSNGYYGGWIEMARRSFPTEPVNEDF